MTCILYVEDHPASRRVMELLVVEVLGIEPLYMLDSSENVVMEIEALPEQPDIIFLDINLKPLTGYEVQSLLREHDDYRHKKIIALTASATAADMRQMREAGFDGAIEKPLSHMTFPQQIQRILDGQTVWETA